MIGKKVKDHSDFGDMLSRRRERKDNMELMRLRGAKGKKR